MSGYEAELTALRQYRDGKTPFSRDSFRQVKKSNLPERPKEVLTASKRRNSIRPAGLMGDEGKTTAVMSEHSHLDEEDTPRTTFSQSPQESSLSSGHTPVSSLAYHDRLTATAQILMETLLEQGALRAQLEDAQKQTRPQTEKELLHENKEKGGEAQIRLRSALLELEKTVQKVRQSQSCVLSFIFTYTLEFYVIVSMYMCVCLYIYVCVYVYVSAVVSW